MLRLAEFARRDFGPGADLLAGLTVAAYLIPQCLAYGELAGLEPIQGLWACLPPLLLYALIGSSPQLSVGPESTTALLTAAVVAPLAGGDPAAAAGRAALLALLVGLVCGVARLARLGFLADLLSRPILVGYMAGVAVIMVTAQAGRLLGIPLQSDSLPGQLVELLGRLGELHGATLALGLGVLLFLLVVQRLVPRAPAPLLAVLLSVVVVAVWRLDARGVAVIGAIPAGLPSPSLPGAVPLEELKRLLAAAVGIAVVGYSDNVLTARAFAARGGYRIDADRELLALGVVNVGAGLMQGFPVSSSGSRTALGDALGSRSQRFSLVALAVVLLALLLLRPLLALFPRAALAAVVIAAAIRLIDLGEFERMRRFKRSEFQLALITMAGVLLTDLLSGVALAVALSMIDLFARLMRPHDAVMGQVPDLAGLHDVSDWPGATTIPGLLIYRYDAPLCFANAEHFLRRALAALDAQPTPVQWFVLNAEAVVEIDITAADVLLELHDTLARRGIVFGFARVKQDLFQQLSRAGVVAKVGAARFFPTLPTAVAAFEQREGAVKLG
ncbi:MAG: sulfate permease [Synechococcaceae cyanobacterium]